jgi:signal transduction histidine kinase
MSRKHDSRFDLEYRITRADQQLRWMWARNFPIKNEQGEIYRLAGVIKDITERKEVEAKNLELALQQERVKILSDFIRDASHEFRTPLSIINSKVYLAGRLQDPAARQMQLQGIQDQSNHILKLVESLVTMTRLDSQLKFDMYALSINSLLQAIYERHRPVVAEHGIDLCLETESNLPQIIGDVDELYAAVVHLIDNAVAHTPVDGKIILRGTRLTEDHLALVVEDTGSGIAAEKLPRIFEKFYRGDEAHSTPGFGLGLPIALKIVEGHGGTISVKSDVSSGSIFTITLPI